jgi:predicted RNA-binding Zn ribbon-like protein
MATLAETLINTYDTFLAQPEQLQSPADLHAFLRQQGVAVRTPPDAATLEAVRTLRETLRAVWTATPIEAATARLNALFATLRATPQVHTDNTGRVTLMLVSGADSSLVEQMTLTSAMEMVTLLQQHGAARLRACDAAPCRDVFVDTSRNGTRRFCSERCANRYNIAAFRERQRGEG